jgi:hypothetical protein
MKREVYLFDTLPRIRSFLSELHFSEGEHQSSAPLGLGFFSVVEANGSKVPNLGSGSSPSSSNAKPETKFETDFDREASSIGGGLSLKVSPAFLDSSIREGMFLGQISPFESSPILFADSSSFSVEQSAHVGRLSQSGSPMKRDGRLMDKKSFSSNRHSQSGSPFAISSKSQTQREIPLPIERWLMTGIHPALFQERTLSAGSSKHPFATQVCGFGTLEESLYSFFSYLQGRVLDLRPAALVIFLESLLISEYFLALAMWKTKVSTNKSWSDFCALNPAERIYFIDKMVVNWLMDEGLHPSVAIVCRNTTEQEALMVYSNACLVRSPASAPYSFRL